MAARGGSTAATTVGQVAGARVLIVLPALNESATVAAVARAAHEAVPGATVVVVDDGSRDETAALARTAGAVVIRHPFNLGVGAAVGSAMRYATRNGFEVVVQVDADGQHPPEAVPSLLAALADGADVAVGSRFVDDDYRVSGPRAAAMGLLRLFVRRRTGVVLPDVTSGLRAHGPRAVAALARDYPAEYLSDTIESLVMASDAGLQIVAVPVGMRVREHGRPSHGPLKSAAYLARVVLLVITLAGGRKRREAAR